MKTIIHVITPIITRNIRQLDDLRKLDCPDLELRHSLLDKGPASIESEFDEALSVPDTIAKAIHAQREGAQAIVIDCMGDPGLDACREAVSVPVFGPCQASMYAACLLAHSFGFITVLERLRPLIDNLATKYGLNSKYASFQAVDIPVLEISHDSEKLNDALTKKALLAVRQDGADALILGCTGFLGCAAAMRRGLLKAGLDVPVIDPIPLTVRLAHALAGTGISHSKQTWPSPEPKPTAGYDMLDGML